MSTILTTARPPRRDVTPPADLAPVVRPARRRSTPTPVVTRAAVLAAPRAPFDVRDVRLDPPRAHEVLVRVVASGVCRTDVHAWTGALPVALPGVLGHEGAGVVEHVGAGVTDVRPGDQVVLGFASCGTCDACRDDHPAYCATGEYLNAAAATGTDAARLRDLDGAPLGGRVHGQSSFAGHVVVPARQVVVVGPDADLTLLAPLGCGVAAGVGAVQNALDPRPGARVAVMGTGVVGLSAVAAAAQRRPEVLVAVGLVPEELELALELGATHALHARADDVAERLTEITRFRGLTAALDTTGDPRVAGTALEALTLRGELVLAGTPVPGARLPTAPLLGGRTVRGVTRGDADPRRLVPQVAALVADGTLDLERLVRRYRLDDLDQALTDLHRERVVAPVVVL